MDRNSPSNMDALLDDLNNQAVNSRALVQDILDVISSGRAPRTESVKQLEQSLDLLRAQYDSICSAAREQLSAEEMPDADSPAADFVEAVRNSVVARNREKIAALQAVLEEFAAVQALAAQYADALQPFQQQARELISRLQQDNSLELEAVERETAGPQLFLQTLACGEVDSDEKLALIDRTAEFYPSRVQYGLVANKYYLPANESAGLAVREAEQQSADPETAEQINHTEEAAVPQAEADVESLCTEAEVGQTEPEQPSAFVQAVEASGILLENDSDIGVPVTEISPNEEKKISASVFRNDLRKAGEAMCKVIIKQLYDRNYITAEKLHILSKMPLNIAENTLDFLYRKGYLRRYEIEPHGDFHCVSPKLIKALTLHDAAKLVGVRQRPATEWGENAEVKASSIAARLVGGKLHMESVKRLLAQNKPEYTNIVMQPTEAGYSLVYPADKALPGDLNIVSFWEDTKECDFLLNEINGLLDEDYEIGRVIFAAFDAQKKRFWQSC